MGRITSTPPPPALSAANLRLLEKLCNACSVSGDESEVRTLVSAEIKSHVDELKTDALGNLLAIKRGSADKRLKVMLAAHMDEVGFMITNEEDNAEPVYRFEVIGGIDPRGLVGKRIVVGKNRQVGVIGAKIIHLTSDEERRQAPTVDNLRIDMGPGAPPLKIGDRAAFATTFHRLGNSLCAKALDNRLGVASLIELLKHPFPHLDLMAAFTVQEELGLRGAAPAAFSFDPDLALVLDCTPANDLPILDQAGFHTSENTRYNTRLGAGPAIYLSDAGTISDPRLIAHFAATADELGIPCQFRQPGGGSTDAGAIHKQRAGIPSLSISVPGRYLHTPASLVRLADWKNTYRLVFAALQRLNPPLLQLPRE